VGSNPAAPTISPKTNQQLIAEHAEACEPVLRTERHHDAPFGAEIPEIVPNCVLGKFGIKFVKVRSLVRSVAPGFLSCSNLMS
jgi:hypothetical protein